MIDRTKLAAALRFYEMAIDPKKLGRAREAFQRAHKLDLVQIYNEAKRELEARPSESQLQCQRKPYC